MDGRWSEATERVLPSSGEFRRGAVNVVEIEWNGVCSVSHILNEEDTANLLDHYGTWLSKFFYFCCLFGPGADVCGHVGAE